MYERVRVTVVLKMRIAHKWHLRESTQTVSGIASSHGTTSEIREERNKQDKRMINLEKATTH